MLMFAEYKYLYLLILVPVFLMGYGIMRYMRARRVKAFGDPALVEVIRFQILAQAIARHHQMSFCECDKCWVVSERSGCYFSSIIFHPLNLRFKYTNNFRKKQKLL